VRTQDLWFIGKALGIPGFEDMMDSELDQMNKALSRAKREDKKEMRSTDGDVLHEQMAGYLTGTGEQEGIEARTQQVSSYWMKKIREKYQGSVIRRTVKSLDYRGEAISGLEPYQEHKCFIQMNDHEYESLEALAANTTDSEAFVRRFASEVSQPVLICPRKGRS
jgi:hypothetical protein